MTGIVKAAWHLAIEQSLAGHRVEVVCPVERGRSRTESIAGVVVHRLALWKGWRVPRVDLSYLLPLLCFGASAEGVDVAHVHSNPFHAIMLRCRRQVIHLHGLPSAYSVAFDRAIRRADAVICCSRYVAEEIAKCGNYPRDRIYPVHSGVDTAVLRQTDRERARAHYAIAPCTTCILFAGRFAREKGLHILIDAVRRVVGAGVADLVLLAAGSTSLGSSPGGEAMKCRASEPDRRAYDLDLQARSSGLPVRFVGSLGPRQLAEFYRSGDVFVCPSTYQEPLGLTNTEAATAGLPIVASHVGGIPEVVQHGENGLLVPAGDSEALAQALLRLIADPELRQRMGAASREIGAQHDWSVVASQVEAVYALAGRRAGERAAAGR